MNKGTLVLLLLLANLTISNDRAYAQITSLLHTQTGNAKIQEKLHLALLNQKLMEKVQSKYDAMQGHKIYQKKIRDFPAGDKIAAFLKTLKYSERMGLLTQNVLQSFDLKKKKLAKALLPGSIDGTVTIEGNYPRYAPGGGSIQVLAFDTFGFYAGAGFVNYYSGSYTIMDLAPGDYYIVTNSWYVDEFYNNVMRDFYKNWRQATLVTVNDEAVTSGIDFDLLEGAKITGYIYDATGSVPISDKYEIEISSATNPEILLEPYGYTDALGFYQITLPYTGSFKIKASVDDYGSDYYNDKEEWASADPIMVESLNDSIPNINFILEEMTPIAGEGARIQGILSGPEELPVNMGFVFAFNTADTSIAGFAISGADSAQGEYSITGLHPGTYILYANHYLELIATPVVAVQGEYYQNAATPDDAEKIIITEQTEVVSDKNFMLDPGGGISGVINDANQAALDSVIVIAIKSDVVIRDKFFTDDIDFGLGLSDQDGNYTIMGLTAGYYILRTISLLSDHAGSVVDEYYENVESIFSFDQATPVSVVVPNVTSGIDFMLAFAGSIRGHFFEIDGITPIIGECTVIAFDAETELPELATSIYNDEDGSYEIKPLANGNYKLLGLMLDESVLDVLAATGKKTVSKADIYFNMLQQEDKIIYVPQYYDSKYTIEEADVISVTAPLSTTDINFEMVRSGAIQGFVNYEPGTPVGADILPGTSVTAFDAISGELRGAANVTFSGGFRISGLPPGAYKVAAWPAADGYSVTYYGGGTTFDDQSSLAVPVTPEGETRTDIELITASGSISGMVYNEDGSATLDGILVLAYDQTGHAISGGISGFDMASQVALNPGEYRIPGLVSGEYYVRTFSLMYTLSQLGMENDLNIESIPSEDDLELSNIELYLDIWHENEPIEINIEEQDLFGLFFNLLFMYDEDIPLFIPLYSVPPAEANLISVMSPNETSDIDFYLPLVDLSSLIADVPDITGKDQIPHSFLLSQNYPNPFNPNTVISWQLAVGSNVELSVYNLLGQKVATLVSEKKAAGYHEVEFNGQNLSSGVYLYRIVVGSFGEAGAWQDVKKMILMK